MSQLGSALKIVIRVDCSDYGSAVTIVIRVVKH